MNKSLQDCRKDAKKITEKFGTPVYVIYEGQLKQNFDRFCTAFQKHWDKIDVSYSVKTNYLPAIVHILYSVGAKIEIVSEFELYLALKTGIPGNKIIYNGPCKTEKAIDVAVKNDVYQINADSLLELQKIDQSGKRHDKKIGVGIRINTEETWRKFGVPLESAEEIFIDASRMENIDVRGIHVHIGTNVFPILYVSTLEKILALMHNLYSKGLKLDNLDLGGGFPTSGVGKWGNPAKNLLVNIFSLKLQKMKLGTLAKWVSRFSNSNSIFRDPPNIETFADGICATLKKKINEYNLPHPMLVLEPGRYLVNNAVTLLVSVIDIKEFKEKWVMVDGGTNLASGLESEAHKVLNVSNESEETEKIILAGPLCHGGDILCKTAQISAVRQGDIIEIFDIGAYSISLSRQFITPRARAVLVKESGELVEVRRPENYEDILVRDAPFFNQTNV